MARRIEKIGRSLRARRNRRRWRSRRMRLSWTQVAPRDLKPPYDWARTQVVVAEPLLACSSTEIGGRRRVIGRAWNDRSDFAGSVRFAFVGIVFSGSSCELAKTPGQNPKGRFRDKKADPQYGHDYGDNLYQTNEPVKWSPHLPTIIRSRVAMVQVRSEETRAPA